MTDVVLIQNNAAHEIFLDKTIDELRHQFHPDLINQMIEVVSNTVNEGDLLDGTQFSKPPEPLVQSQPQAPANILARMNNDERVAFKALLIEHGVLTAERGAEIFEE